jgi:transcription elongation GreA/GreB family factor
VHNPAIVSRAFVKESDGDDAEALPERAISPHPNLVTVQGLARIDAQIRDLEADRERTRGDADKATRARIDRDLRYWVQRRTSARVVEPPAKKDRVRFGLRVTFRFEDGTEHTFRLVGEDEADPAAGLVSYASPVAEALMSQAVGDEVELMGRRAEIIAID